MNTTKYCSCEKVTSVYDDEDEGGFGYWEVCGNCHKPIEGTHHYFNHYDGEDHEDIFD